MEYGAFWNVPEGGRPKHLENNLSQCQLLHYIRIPYGMNLGMHSVLNGEWKATDRLTMTFWIFQIKRVFKTSFKFFNT